MKTIAVTQEEGGAWQDFEPATRRFIPLGRTVHAIKFDNGVIWDAMNGFRGLEGKPMRLVIRVPMGRKKLRKRRTADGSFKWAP